MPKVHDTVKGWYRAARRTLSFFFSRIQELDNWVSHDLFYY